MAPFNTIRSANTINRRAFLRAAAGCAAIPWVAPVVAAASQQAAHARQQWPIGFIELQSPSSLAIGESGPMQPRAIPAERLTHGCPQLQADGVRLHFHGIRFPENVLPHNLNAITVNLEMQTQDDSMDPIPWHLWTYSNQGVLNVSAEVSAHVPLRSDGALVFTLNMRSGMESSQTCRVRLITGSGQGIPKLCTGIYCVAVPDIDPGFRFDPETTCWECMKCIAPGDQTLLSLADHRLATQLTAPFTFLTFSIADACARVPDIT